MPENYIELPDTKKLVVFETNQHPDFPATSVNVQETLIADIPTYSVVADNIAPALNKNIISIFNNLTTKRIRIQQVYVYPRTAANNTITLQLGYINSAPTGGTDLNIARYAADFPTSSNVIAQSENTSPNPIANTLFGGITFNLNTAGTYIIFEKKSNCSALQLRPNGQDGITVRQVVGSATGSISVHVVFTLD